jgi:hypothetical protein
MTPRRSAPITIEAYVPTFPLLSSVASVALLQAVFKQCATLRSKLVVLA